MRKWERRSYGFCRALICLAFLGVVWLFVCGMGGNLFCLFAKCTQNAVKMGRKMIESNKLDKISSNPLYILQK
jgi:hypothetical protein